jgi:hypothetical protein
MLAIALISCHAWHARLIITLITPPTIRFIVYTRQHCSINRSNLLALIACAEGYHIVWKAAMIPAWNNTPSRFYAPCLDEKTVNCTPKFSC